MLKISEQTRVALRQAAMPGFAECVREQLADAHPHLLPCFPTPIQRLIVRNMLDRAMLWELSRGDALYAFCSAMISIAPNFDEFPAIAQQMSDHRESLDDLIAKIVGGMPQSVNKKAVEASSVLPLFTPVKMRGGGLLELCTHAVPIALHDRPEANQPADAIRDATEHTARLGLSKLTDAPLVVAACRSFWGNNFDQLVWAAEVWQEDWSAAARLALLRLRLALEFGRYL